MSPELVIPPNHLILCRPLLLPWQAHFLPLNYQGSPYIHCSCLVASDSLWPHGLQHARPPCPSPTSRVYPNSCQLSPWCHPTISSSVIPFSSHSQSSPASGSFPMSWLFTSGGQSIGVSASTSVLPMNIQDWPPLGWTGWSPCSSRDSQESSPTPQFKNISSLVLGWRKHKLESRLPGEISIISDMQMTPPLWQKVKKNQRASWWKWKRRVKKLA